MHCLLLEEEHSNSVRHIAALITHHGIKHPASFPLYFTPHSHCTVS